MKNLLDSIWGDEDTDAIIIPCFENPPAEINISCGGRPPEPPYIPEPIDYAIGGNMCRK